ncbi:MAG TPA: hypothetical protein ENN22_06315 [bacterium]|nr:hypothetical protein [bacterium]
MGKAALIVVIGLSITLGFFRFILLQRPVEATMNTSKYFSLVTAKNVAHSATNNYLKKLYQNKSLRGSFAESDAYINGGIDTVRITSSSSVTSLGDTVNVSVVAYYGGEKSELEVTLIASSLTIPPVTASVAFPGPNPVLDLNGSPLIDGANHDYNGNPSASCEDLPGVAVASSADSANMVNSLISSKMDSKVKGIGADPSVHVRDTQDPSTYLQPLIANADYYTPPGTYSSIEFGSQESPVIVYGTGDLKFSGGVVGHGILIIDGTLTLSGNFFWYGVVYVIGETPEIFNSVGTNRIVGGVVLGGSDKIARLKGTADIQYSCETVENVMNNTNSLITFALVSWYE